MNAKVEAPEYRFDLIKWLLVLAIVAGMAVANSQFGEVALLYRILGLVAAGVVAIFIAVKTAKGAAFWNLMLEAQVEVRKVVWPTRQETNQTTLIVLAVVFVMALILWALDSVLGWLASLIIA